MRHLIVCERCCNAAMHGCVELVTCYFSHGGEMARLLDDGHQDAAQPLLGDAFTSLSFTTHQRDIKKCVGLCTNHWYVTSAASPASLFCTSSLDVLNPPSPHTRPKPIWPTICFPKRSLLPSAAAEALGRAEAAAEQERQQPQRAHSALGQVADTPDPAGAGEAPSAAADSRQMRRTDLRSRYTQPRAQTTGGLPAISGSAGGIA
eukprot:5116707-Pleurochrysis_carterae.AAC.5